MNQLDTLLQASGIAQMAGGQALMILVGLVLLFMAINKGFEPLLLVPIGVGAIFVNIPGAGFYDAPVYDAMGHLVTPLLRW